MKPDVFLSLAAIAYAGLALRGGQVSAQGTTTGSVIGEVRAFAINPADQHGMRELHGAGWLEATGQLLSTQDFPSVHGMIGYGWTADNVPPDRFALPDLRYLSSRPGASLDHVTVELLGGDLVTGGRTRGPRDPSRRLFYCLYVGRDATELDLKTARLKRGSH